MIAEASGPLAGSMGSSAGAAHSMGRGPRARARSSDAAAFAHLFDLCGLTPDHPPRQAALLPPKHIDFGLSSSTWEALEAALCGAAPPAQAGAAFLVAGLLQDGGLRALGASERPALIAAALRLTGDSRHTVVS